MHDELVIRQASSEELDEWVNEKYGEEARAFALAIIREYKDFYKL